ncbi:monovalent cation:proton antiporter-2 (CPA2) family protein [Paracnuella aquatica]|uniref:monovalent cation:proton antiporter-2 (CPA2) family protein n=1 Tax=Paracnuella aquatica TaxID=2268757 RepID=UPI000DEFDE7D|nr:monovalent cation:proton antiporter-2 (CPA2) family protein [Paracnuella aquatica]RPD51688.1 potassium transporter [Paracnuella aquatica]
MDQNNIFFQAMVYLAAAVVMVPIAKKLNLGSVLGYLLAGVLIGPAVLGFVGHEGESVMHFAEFGVVMMLFIIGLELEPTVLWRMRRSIIGMGGLQVAGTALLLFTGAMMFGLPWQQAVALGGILALSSTAIVLQTMQEKGLMKTASGQSAFSVLLFQDIAVIPMLALFPLLQNLPLPASADDHSSTSMVAHLPAWLQALVLLGVVASIIVAARFIMRPLFRLIAASRLHEMFTATALLIVVGITVLMTMVGLSPALGSFLAGVVLANSEYRHELESNIEPFKGLLLGLFFISVGATIDFRQVLDQPLQLAGIVLGLMVLKVLVLFAIGKIFKMGLDQNLIYSVALSQVGEFAFVLFSFSASNGILPQALIDTMIAAVAISMALSPLLLLALERFVLQRIVTNTPDDDRPADTIMEENPVIIAGFGDFGNAVGRFLRAHKVGVTILDNDVERVELLRRLGFKVYYGDASRSELLASAGAAKAKLIIITIEPSEKRLELINTIKKHFPNLRMLVRASNRFDAYDQMNAGMLHIYRETIDTALRVGVDTMHFLGHRNYTATRAARQFLRLDEANLKKLSSIRDPDEYINTAREKIEELEQTLQSDLFHLGKSEKSWDEEGLIAEALQPNPINNGQEKAAPK